MASNITLSAGVRQNLLALQNTAQLLSVTQNRLATGKKVNSALDNPGNFFASQSLSNRASDLNGLVDSIGQAQKTLEAADNGITSLTKLVESAKSIAKQALQAPLSTTTYGAVTQVGTVATGETLGTVTGASFTVANDTTYAFTININGTGDQSVSYISDADATQAEIVSNLQSAFATARTTAGFAASDITLTQVGATDVLKIDAVHADIDFVISANALGANTGIANNTYNSTSLFDTTGAGSLTVAVNGGANQTISIGTGVGQVSTLAELNTQLANLSGITASATATTVTLTVPSSSSANSLAISGTAAVLTELGLTAGTYAGVASTPTPNATRTSLQTDFNNVLAQIDALAKDASYNGVNLLFGDDLKVVFNELGTSSQTITGVTFDALGLGLSTVTGSAFQDNANVDTALASLDAALSTLRTQAAKFGSNLTTVQIRQEFTKSLINTLQTGSDQLVLADTNEEGANLLALQTRQSLSTTSLSLAAQADQAVLRLFG
jgi:flagellin-like hook-associated protein FlgL